MSNNKERQGFVLYHDIVDNQLRYLSPEEFKSVVMSAAEYSIDCSKGIETEWPKGYNGAAAGCIKSLCRTIDASVMNYAKTTCRNKASRRQDKQDLLRQLSITQLYEKGYSVQDIAILKDKWGEWAEIKEEILRFQAIKKENDQRSPEVTGGHQRSPEVTRGDQHEQNMSRTENEQNGTEQERSGAEQSKTEQENEIEHTQQQKNVSHGAPNMMDLEGILDRIEQLGYSRLGNNVALIMDSLREKGKERTILELNDVFSSLRRKLERK